MRRCNILLNAQPAHAARQPGNEHLLPLTVRIETDNVSDKALDDFKRNIPVGQRYWGGKEDDLTLREFAWFVHPAALDTVKKWASTWYDEPWLKDGARELNLRTGQLLEQQGLFG